MELTVLGCRGRCPSNNSACSCYLLSGGGKNILIDFGTGVTMILENYINVYDIDAIILSHTHFDHASDIISFGYMLDYKNSQNKTNKKINIYLPEGNSIIRQALDSIKGFAVSDINENIHLLFNGFSIDFYKMNHPVLTFGVMVNAENKLFYTADTIYCESLENAIGMADYVIADACLTDDNYIEGVSPHISINKLATIIGNRDKNIVLSHLTDDKVYNEHILEKFKAIHNNAVLANEGMKIKF